MRTSELHIEEVYEVNPIGQKATKWKMKEHKESAINFTERFESLGLDRQTNDIQQMQLRGWPNSNDNQK